MSERSAAWYAVPANREKRTKNMRAYQAALVELGQEYPVERRRAYSRALAVQPSRHAYAQQRAYAQVRDAHKDEFRQILARLREA
jgi:hypothetical protein